MGSVLSTSCAPVRWERLARFYGLACSGAVLCSLAAHRLVNPAAKMSMAALMMLTPLMAGTVVQKSYGEPTLEAMGVRRGGLFSRWGLLAALTPAAFVASALVASLAVPGVRCAPGEAMIASIVAAGGSQEQVDQIRCFVAAPPLEIVQKSLLKAVVVGGIVNIIPCFGEEVGWRGWLLRELAPLGFWRASLISGAMWGLWHAPLTIQGHNYPQHPGAGIAMMTAFCALLSPSMTLLRWKSRSVWSAAIFHGVLNAGGALPMLMLAGGNDLTIGVTGLAGLLVLAGANVTIFALCGDDIRPVLEDAWVAKQ
mmetsp:Transcript_100218/g.259142  ORF Transcript_100218/g.259142 Transcript_100218/m.259142 type:complete len:311 (+) Transcript_100218:58-990(+)